MRVRILCVGRLKDSPERTLVDDYLERARRLGQGLGVRAVEEVETPAGGGRIEEGRRLLARRDGGVLVRLDERGSAWTSTEFSRRLGAWRDAGQPCVDFAIGGADGLSPEVEAAADCALALGALTWPHRLVRVLLAEQIYRALSIEAGSPYHRE
jgi:23S rRNA (pseudouridine1915-N3)-methyltransferase